MGRESDQAGTYGYDACLTVGPNIHCQPGERVQKEFEGGLYAVTRCRPEDVVDTWHRLHEWVTRSPYHMGEH
ncbi:MAG: GyrI-like domain-containing protein [Chloroflexi bacterium]|nr:GyrI-like domain-containing protein [Chloroflexota bacterium]